MPFQNVAAPTKLPTDQMIQGDCTTVLLGFPSQSVDFVLTDPPYIVDYHDRAGRTIANDQTPDQILKAFHQVARILKPNKYCFSFYSWQHIDAFAHVWEAVGLDTVGHIVFPKRYASGQRHTTYRHECAYLLAKGRPPPPEHPIDDVLEWHYTGNRRHPTEKSVDTLKPIVEAFSNAGDLVLDPYSGSGSALVASALAGRRYLGIEIEEQYCVSAQRRLDGVRRHLTPKL